MKLTAEQLYKKLVEDYKLIGETASIKFTVKDLSILIKIPLEIYYRNG